MDDYHKEQERAQRHERKRQRLESSNPVCAVCGYANLPSLMGVPFSKLPQRLRRKLSEDHHLAGRKAGDWVVTICRNCHEILSDDQYDWDPRLREPETQQERLASFLQGLADWFRVLGQTLVATADALQGWVRQLLEAPPDDASG